MGGEDKLKAKSEKLKVKRTDIKGVKVYLSTFIS
jgi:hypothetical protein